MRLNAPVHLLASAYPPQRRGCFGNIICPPTPNTFQEALTTYLTIRAQANQPNLNEGLVVRATAVRRKALATEFEGKCLKMSALAAGLSKKRQYQLLLRQMECPSDAVLLPILQFAHEQAGQNMQSSGAASSTGTTVT